GSRAQFRQFPKNFRIAIEPRRREGRRSPPERRPVRAVPPLPLHGGADAGPRDRPRARPAAARRAARAHAGPPQASPRSRVGGAPVRARIEAAIADVAKVTDLVAARGITRDAAIANLGAVRASAQHYGAMRTAFRNAGLAKVHKRLM